MKTYSLATALLLASTPLIGCQKQDKGTINPSNTQADATASMAAAQANMRDTVYAVDSDVDDVDNDPPVVEAPVVYTSVEVFIDPTLQAACGVAQPKLYFAFDSAEVMDRGDRSMKMLADCLNARPLDGDPVKITGYADPRGTESYNRGLGLDRADAVGQILTANGVAADRIDTYSWGEAKASDNPDDWSTDRKVVVMLDR